MQDHDRLAERFEDNRTNLRAVAYRMLGSVHEADDAVQEAWLRLSRTDASSIGNLGRWLTTVVSRVCLDMLRSRASRREEPLAPAYPNRSRATRTAWTRSTRRWSRTRSVWRCWSCSTHCRRPNASPSAPRHVRRALRRDRADRGALFGCDPAAREPGPAPGAGRERGSRRRSCPSAGGGGGVPRRGARWSLRSPAHAARPRRRAPRRSRRLRAGASEEVRGAEAVAGTFSGRARAAQPALLGGAVGLVWTQQGEARMVFDFKLVDSKVTEIELIADPERIRDLQPTILGT
jgi:RNA polymerase sigma-70 factor, ECF subfamily